MLVCTLFSHTQNVHCVFSFLCPPPPPITQWITTNTPLSRDVKLIEARFGSGMSSFFDFFQFTFLNSILLMPVHVYLLVHQCIVYIGSINTMVAIVPKWTLYSSFNDSSFAYVCLSYRSQCLYAGMCFGLLSVPRLDVCCPVFLTLQTGPDTLARWRTPSCTCCSSP